MTNNPKLIDQMRPKKESKRMQQLRKTSGEQFYQDYHTEFVDVSCPACGTESEPIFTKFFFQHKKCPQCNTLYCAPRPPEHLLFTYYREYEAPNAWTELLISTNTARKVAQYQPRVQLLIDVLDKHYPEPLKKAYDIGAGSGAFTLALQNSGYFEQVVAVDITQSCIEACQKLSLQTLKSTIQDLPTESTDYLSMNDLFEHLYSPEAFLQECRRVLKHNGVISIATPNGEGFDFKIFEQETVNLTPPEHLNYFNPYSIRLLLERYGFEVLYLETPGKLDVDIVRREVAENGYDLKSKNAYLHHLLFEHPDKEKKTKELQEFLAQNQLSSHLLVLAQKS